MVHLRSSIQTPIRSARTTDHAAATRLTNPIHSKPVSTAIAPGIRQPIAAPSELRTRSGQDVNLTLFAGAGLTDEVWREQQRRAIRSPARPDRRLPSKCRSAMIANVPGPALRGTSAADGQVGQLPDSQFSSA